ncbi:MAG: Asp-tRNA(Asn)/Glu-tRNA(Gln) amidotransferase GatCAB subunit A, partial [Candidatus Moraniibacteriota bacterium]
CGVVGLKPTYGRVSRYGVIAMGSSFDQVGPIAHTVEDVAIVLSRIAGRDERDATSAHSGDKPYEDYCVGDLAGAKIGIPKEYLGEGLDDRVKDVFFAAVEKYKSYGAEIVDITLPHTEHALATYYIIIFSEFSSNLARFDGIRYGGSEDVDAQTILDQYLQTRATCFGPEVKRRIMLGTYTLSAGYYDAYYKKAQKVRALIKKDFAQAFEKVDYIFTPTAPEVAFPLGTKNTDPLAMYLSDIYTITANLAGIPALSLPIGTVRENDNDLPVGGQLMGKWFDEEGILNAGHTFEINA